MNVVTEDNGAVDTPRSTTGIFSASVQPSPSLLRTPTAILPTAEAPPRVDEANFTTPEVTPPVHRTIPPSTNAGTKTTTSTQTVEVTMESDSDEFYDIDDVVPPEQREQAETEPELELTDAERTLAARKKIDQDKMRAAVAAATQVFKVGQIVAEKVPKQILLPGEPARIIVRIAGFNQGGYALATKHGIITKHFGGDTLHSVPMAQALAYEKIIPIVPMRDGKVLKIPMTKVYSVAL